MAKTKFENINCNLCGANDYTVKYLPDNKGYFPKQIFSASGSIMGTQQIVRCNKCKLIYVQPRIEGQFITEAYKESTDELYVSQAKSREKTFRSYLQLVNKYAPAKGKILDIGAAAGFFLKVARDEGWDICGLELSRWLCDYGNDNFNLNIKNGLLKDIHYPSNHFDVITMWDVLEHMPDPLSELREINRILKPDGILIINYPDIGTALAKISGKKWWFLLSGHLYYFDRNSISKLLKKCGFEVIKSKMHFQSMELGHLAKMLALYNKTASVMFTKIFESLNLSAIELKYYASQTNVISRKNKYD